MNILNEVAKNIKLAIFDVDGVLTDGNLLYTDSGIHIKAFHVHDGLGIQLLQKSGVEVAIITSHDSQLITKRMQDLGIRHVYQGIKNKIPAYEELLNTLQLLPEQVSYMGDDLPDLPLIRRSGLGITVPNAVPLVKQYADWITQAYSGKGAVREACERLMQAQGTLPGLLHYYLD